MSQREDVLFDVLNEEGMKMGGVKVDINPIVEGKSGCLDEYLQEVEKYFSSNLCE